MEYACGTVAALMLKLKRQYEAVIDASPARQRDKEMTRQIAALGPVIKELEDAVIVLEVRLQQNQDSTAMASQG
jgi:hypothetical protein